MSASGLGVEEQKQHHHRHHLGTAGGGAGSTADEHKQHRGGLGPVRQRRLVYRGIAGCTGGNRLEEAVKHPLPWLHVSQGRRVVPLHPADEEGAAENQKHRTDEHHSGVDGELPEIPHPYQLFPHEKAQAAYHNQSHDGNAHHRIVVESNHTGVGGDFAENIKAGVAEGGNRVEDSPGGRLFQSEVRQKPQGKNQCAGQLDGNASQHRPLLQPHHAGHIADAESLGHHHSMPQAQFSFQQENHGAGNGHKAQTADFNQAQNHNLTKAAP